MPNQLGMSRKCKTLNTYIGWTSYYVYALLSIQCKKNPFSAYSCAFIALFFFSARSYSSSSSYSSICLSFFRSSFLSHSLACARALFCFLLHILLFGFWFQLVSLLRIMHIVRTLKFSAYIYIKRCRKLNCRCSWFELSSWFLGRFRRWTLLTAYNVHHTLRLY